MIGKFRLAKRFSTVLAKGMYQDVFFDRFNSVSRGFYLLVGQQQLAEMVQNNNIITFVKISSTERFGSQDITQLEFYDPKLLTPEQKRMIYLLNSVIDTGCYSVVEEQIQHT